MASARDCGAVAVEGQMSLHRLAAVDDHGVSDDEGKESASEVLDAAASARRPALTRRHRGVGGYSGEA